MESHKIVKFLKDHEKIKTEHDGSYGPFSKGQEAALPVDLANLLIKLNVAEDTRKIPEEPSFKQMFKGEVLSGYVEASKSRTLNQFPSKEVDDDVEKALEELNQTADRLRKLRERNV